MPGIHKGILFLSNSSLATIAACSRQAYLRNHKLYEPRATNSSAATIGSLFHKALFTYYTSYAGSPSLASSAAMNVLTKAYPNPAPEEPRLSLANLQAILSYYFDSPQCRSFLTTNTDIHAEHPFCLPLTTDGTIAYYGTIDLVSHHYKTGAITITDHKTTGNLTQPWLSSFTLSSQFSGYLWAAQQLFTPPPTACLVNAIEIRELPTSTRKCSRHGIPYADCRQFHTKFIQEDVSRTPAQLADWKRAATTFAKDYWRNIEAAEAYDCSILDFTAEGIFTDECKFCPFTPLCRHVITEADLDTQYTTREPFPPALQPVIDKYLATYAQ